jgi:hypothetical protein
MAPNAWVTVAPPQGYGGIQCSSRYSAKPLSNSVTRSRCSGAPRSPPRRGFTFVEAASPADIRGWAVEARPDIVHDSSNDFADIVYGTSVPYIQTYHLTGSSTGSAERYLPLLRPTTSRPRLAKRAGRAPPGRLEGTNVQSRAWRSARAVHREGLTIEGRARSSCGLPPSGGRSSSPARAGRTTIPVRSPGTSPGPLSPSATSARSSGTSS